MNFVKWKKGKEMKHILFLTFILWAGICKANDIKITVENSLMDGSPTPYFRIENKKKMIQVFYTKRNGKNGVVNCEQMFQGKYMQLICIAQKKIWSF